MLWFSLLFSLIGLLVGVLLNILADDLPARIRPTAPHCPRCNHVHPVTHWLAVGRALLGGCSNCGARVRKRVLFLEIGTALVFAALLALVEPAFDRMIYAVYAAVLLLVIVIDIEHRLILHVVTFPTTAFALLASLFLTNNNIIAAALGAVVAFLFFYFIYWLGQRLFGAGAFGFGDVTLAMTMGAMFGLHQVVFALVLGVLLGGLWSVIGLASGRMTRYSHFAYGPFLAAGGLIILFWGSQLLEWYTRTPP